MLTVPATSHPFSTCSPLAALFPLPHASRPSSSATQYTLRASGIVQNNQRQGSANSLSFTTGADPTITLTKAEATSPTTGTATAALGPGASFASVRPLGRILPVWVVLAHDSLPCPCIQQHLASCLALLSLLALRHEAIAPPPSHSKLVCPAVCVLCQELGMRDLPAAALPIRQPHGAAHQAGTRNNGASPALLSWPLGGTCWPEFAVAQRLGVVLLWKIVLPSVPYSLMTAVASASTWFAVRD